MSSEHRLAVRCGECRPPRRGIAVDLTDTDHSTETVRRAVRGETASLTIAAPPVSRWWSTLCVPTDGTPPLDRLVAAARARGVHVPEERALAAAERALRSHTVATVNLDDARERLAAAGTEVETLREQVATARGRLEARRETGADTDAAAEALTAAAARLSEAETERLAAEQAHDAARRRAREARSAREERLRLQDRVANRRRDARRALVGELVEAFALATAAVPGEASLSLDPLAVEGDPVTAALAAVRLADLQAPVVDETGRFDSAVAAAERLDALVIRC